ncbi:hypothetical protein NITHO_1560011 [Nitrolancea hollandica Lb]|uniref:S-adenosyl-L-methionine-dependent methyltransferase n=1 Tax=Nitrolancea hollandica Lb TaxID=1129897 RepID=I4EDM1_9BACT|nr:hypothetical protein NITHO_1560011 [Nitrolancea hollandica Lb]
MVIDQKILDAVQTQQVDTVLNLACGLDTRPFRLPLPSTLTWIEVDLPEVIAYKGSILTNDRVACRLESIGMDLSDSDARRRLFAHVDGTAHRVLVVSEGFLLYLSANTVAALARDLHAFPRFSYWMTDVTSPLLLRLDQVFGRPVQRWVSPMRFAPRDKRAFFEPYGWTIRDFRPLAVEGERLHREPPFAPLLRAGRIVLRGKWRDAFRDSSGVLLLERSSQPAPVLPGGIRRHTTGTLLKLRHRHRGESKESIEEYRMEYTGWNPLVPALELLAVILVIGAAIVIGRRLRQRG